MQKPMWSHLRVQIKLALLPLSAELYKIKNLNSKHVWVWTQRPGRRVCKWWLNDFCSVYKNSSEFSNEAMSNTFSRNAGQNNTEMCLKQLSAHTSHTHTHTHMRYWRTRPHGNTSYKNDRFTQPWPFPNFPEQNDSSSEGRLCSRLAELSTRYPSLTAPL